MALPRLALDQTLRDAARDAGSRVYTARAGAPIHVDGRLAGFELSDGTELGADVVIGADGATSRVATAAGLVDERRALWGFALRSYVGVPVDLPTIVLWDEARWRGFPGYGWIFPGPGSRANLGVGVGVLGDRAAAGHAARSLEAFVAVLQRFGLLDPGARLPAERLGGWLKMGMVGTNPARGRVLLVGDAAGLVNPLQGEGISEALASGRAAAEAVLACPAAPAGHYRSFLAQRYAGFQASNAAVQAALVRRARIVAGAGRLLTAPAVGRALAGGWAVYWNELLDGAMPGAARNTAALATAIARATTRHGRVRRSVMGALDDDP